MKRLTKIIFVLFFILFIGGSNVYAEGSNERYNDELYVSGLRFSNYKETVINSGVIRISKDTTIELNFNIMYYGKGNIDLLEVHGEDIPGLSIESINTGDASGKIYITVTDDISNIYNNVNFEVTGGATTYSQTITMEVVSKDENENLKPNPDTNMPTVDPLPDTNTPTVDPLPDTNTPTVDPLPDTNTPTVDPLPKTNTPTVDPLPDTNVSTDISRYNELPKTGEMKNKYYKYVGIIILVTSIFIIFSIKKEKLNV